MTNDEHFTADERRALETIKVTAAADPFALEAFRKLAFWFKAFVIARANDKPVLALGARKAFHLLYPELLDVTGTTDVLFEGMNRRTRADREAAPDFKPFVPTSRPGFSFLRTK
jgi:hypothetical protein